MVEKNILYFFSNKTSGAQELAEIELQIIAEMIENRKNNIEKFLNDSVNTFPEMVPIRYIKNFFNKNKINKRNLKRIKENLGDEKYIKKAECLFDNEKIILTFSNSSSVRKAIIKYKSSVKKIYCCHSLPLGEGEELCSSLNKYSIESQLIEDTEVSRYIENVDFVLIGADAVDKNNFINKIGTLQLALIAYHFKKPLFVITSKYKLLDDNSLKKLKLGKYFEKVDRKYVKKFII